MLIYYSKTFSEECFEDKIKTLIVRLQCFSQKYHFFLIFDVFSTALIPFCRILCQTIYVIYHICFTASLPFCVIKW